MISFKHVYKEIPAKSLLNDVNFTLGAKEKVGLIGQNGSGKSTLLKIALGLEDYDQGTVQAPGECFGYLPQLFDFSTELTVREHGVQVLDGTKNMYQFEKNLRQLGLDTKVFTQKITDLSSGQQMRVKLAEILLARPSVLILDEPTNHLDIEGIGWMSNFVKNFDGIVLMVSHDRAFLDETTNVIFEIDEGRLHIFPGNYSDYVAQKSSWIEKREEAYKRQEKKREQMERLIENARKLKGGKQRGKAVRSAKKRMEREVLRKEITAYSRETVENIDFRGETHTGKLMLRLDHVSHHYGEVEVIKNASFELRGNDRVWLYGPNGVGKSTLLNIVTGVIAPTQGTVSLGANITWGYFRQNQEQFDLSLTVRQFIEAQTPMAEASMYGFLKQYIFPRQYLDKKLFYLSPGERARLAFGIFSLQKLDLLILDEPTNHLDIWTKEAIERSLVDYQGAILLVSHDRYFVSEVQVNHVLTIKNKILVRHG